VPGAEVTLPVTGFTCQLHTLTGAIDLVILEQPATLPGAAAVARACAAVDDGAPLAGDELPVADLDVLIVELRRQALGDEVVGEASCATCGATVDLRFRLDDYRRHHAPRPTRSAVPHEPPGWWRLVRSEVTFRLPEVRDVLELPPGRRARNLLVDRCLRGDPTAAQVRRVERAMAALAPVLRGPVAGRCPDCARPVDLEFDAREFCLTELRNRALDVLADVDLLARTYHWSEQEILSMPSTRRTAYVDLVEEGRSAQLDTDGALVA
jgi:hypothetical protein